MRLPDRARLRPEQQRSLRAVFVALTVGALRTARFGADCWLRRRPEFPKVLMNKVVHPVA
jgi:hypothetical protein